MGRLDSRLNFRLLLKALFFEFVAQSLNGGAHAVELFVRGLDGGLDLCLFVETLLFQLVAEGLHGGLDAVQLLV